MAERAPDPAENRTAFERFEALTRKLAAVPKSEVDALRKKEKRRSRASEKRR